MIALSALSRDQQDAIQRDLDAAQATVDAGNRILGGGSK